MSAKQGIVIRKVARNNKARYRLKYSYNLSQSISDKSVTTRYSYSKTISTKKKKYAYSY